MNGREVDVVEEGRDVLELTAENILVGDAKRLAFQFLDHVRRLEAVAGATREWFGKFEGPCLCKICPADDCPFVADKIRQALAELEEA